jgi:hypothetical protein
MALDVEHIPTVLVADLDVVVCFHSNNCSRRAEIMFGGLGRGAGLAKNLPPAGNKTCPFVAMGVAVNI